MTAEAATPARRRLFGEKQRFMILLILPAALALLLFQIVPIAIGANASFRDWSLYAPKKSWVGFKQYVAVLSDPTFFHTVLLNTVMFMAATVTLSLLAGLGLALILNRRFRLHAVVRTVILLPLMVAPVIASIMMRWMFNDQFGVANVVLELLGFDGIPWLNQRWTAFGVILFADVWLWTPWFAILLLAALQSLPKEPFEAAAIDGTTRWRTFRYITLPMLRPVIVVSAVIRSIDAFRVFDQVWVISGGGPARQTEVFSVYTYVEAFQKLNFAKGSAAALIGAAVIVVIGAALYRFLTRSLTVSR
jgi:multiple sugar transport system permease protein